MKIENLFPDGVWKSKDEYLIKCPYCGDNPTHNHCYVNVSKGRFFCHYCGVSGTMDRLSRDFGNGEFIEKDGMWFPAQERRKLYFERFKKVTGLSSTMDRMALSYLFKRGMGGDEIEKYNVRYSEYGRYYGRVIFPIIEDGKVVCVMARSFLENVKPKWLFPHKGETLLSTSETLFGYDRLYNSISSNVVIVEGGFDVVGLNRINYVSSMLKIVGIQGTVLHSTQLNKLLFVSNEDTTFFVMLDKDAKGKKSIEVGRRLKKYSRNVVICKYPDGITEPEHIKDFKTFGVILSNGDKMDFDLELKDILK